MKKILIGLLLIPEFVSALNVTDIDSMVVNSASLIKNVAKYQRLAFRLQILRENNFKVTVEDSTATVSLNAQDRVDIFGQYNEIKKQIQNDVVNMP